MYCNNCGYQMPDGSDYCDSCGNKMFQPPSKEEAAAAASEIAAASAQAQPAYSNPFAAPQAQPYTQMTPPQPQQPAYSGSAPQQPYGQPPQYGNAQPNMSPYGYPTFQQDYTPAAAKTNTMALVGFILSFLCLPPVALVLSIIGLSQINRTKEGGRGLAIAGIIISIVQMVGGVIFGVVSALADLA